MNTIKLYLDDLRNPPDTSWTVARNAEEAQALLANPELVVECVSLDHDMGECGDCSTSFPPRGFKVVSSTCRHKMTGMDLVNWMVGSGRWPLFKPNVHSENETEGLKMIRVIEANWKASASTPNCGCYVCSSPAQRATTFILCEVCGNKRCPHGTWHAHACTNSNKSGQPGSRY